MLNKGIRQLSIILTNTSAIIMDGLVVLSQNPLFPFQSILHLFLKQIESNMNNVQHLNFWLFWVCRKEIGLRRQSYCKQD